jgi:nucleoside-diphosphate-sugar epimerase
VLLQERCPGFATLILRPATVCGYAPRLRLDLTVNILTNHAVNKKVINVFGGRQMRPNIHIEDVTDLYIRALEWPEQAIDGKIFNAGYDNHTVMELAEMVRTVVGQQVEICTTPSSDLRSYHISSEKIRSELGFVPSRSVKDAVSDLLAAFRSGRIPDPMADIRYYNIKTMQALTLS